MMESQNGKASGADATIALCATGVMVVVLLFTVTNLVPFSGSLLVLLPIVPLLMLMRRNIPTIVFATAIWFAFLLVYELLYDPGALLQFDFYRRDGNVFVSYAPLLVLPLLPMTMAPEKLMKLFFVWTAGVSAIFLMYFWATGHNAFTNDPEFFRLLFEAHNAAGGFYATVLMLAIGFYWRRREPLVLLTILVFALALWETNSRGSMIGAFGAAFIFLFRAKWRAAIFVALTILNIGAIAAYSSRLDENVYMTHDYSDFEGNHEEYSGLGTFGSDRDWTIADRVAYKWPRALRLFEYSPIVGIGLGAYDDGPYEMTGIEGVFMRNAHPTIRYGLGHAHHSYLMFLCETGIIGLALALWVMFSLIRTSRFLPGGIGLAFEAATWALMFAAFTEHRLTAPAEVLPLTILFGMVCSVFPAHRLSPKRLELPAHRPITAQAT